MVEYNVDFYEWDKRTGKWMAYDNAAAQLEFVMLDPYYRIPLTQVSRGRPTYTAQFKAPDKLGVFQFKINYTRSGYTALDVRTKVRLLMSHARRCLCANPISTKCPGLCGPLFPTTAACS